MKISCDIIRDILPLYAEDMVSPATHDFVDEHLSECESCTQELQKLKEKTAVPMDADVTTIRRIGKHIKMKQILLVLCVLLTAFGIYCAGLVFLQSPYYLTYDQAVESVAMREDGGLTIDYSRGIIGIGTINGGENNNIQWTMTNRLAWEEGKWRKEKIQKMTEEEVEAELQRIYNTTNITQRERDIFNNVNVYDNISGEKLWYWNPDGSYHLIWDGGAEEPLQEAYVHRDGDIYLYLCMGCLVLAVLCFAAVRSLKKPKVREIYFCIGSLCASVSIHLLLATGGDFTDIVGTRSCNWLNNIVITTITFTLTAILWRRLYLLNHPAK